GRQMTCAAVQRALSDGDGRTRRRRRIRGHLRTCHACSSFEGLLRQRPAQLAALVPPLPAAASVGLLARLLSHGSAQCAASSTAAAALADRAQATVPALVIPRESNEPPATVAGRDDAAGAPGIDVGLEAGPDREAQTATPVTRPIHGVSAGQRPSSLSVTPPG